MNFAIPLIVMPIPTVIATLVVVKTIQFRRASHWVEGRARIKSSNVKTSRHQFSGEALRVTHSAAVTYEFHIGGEAFHGDRISIGEVAPNEIEAKLNQYAVGVEVPVFYDPKDPTRSVLERDLPVKLGCMWSGAAIGMLIGVGVTIAIDRSESIDDALQRAWPRSGHPLMSICIALMGCFCLMMYWANRRIAAQSKGWGVVQGSIVSSTTESFHDTSRRSRGTTMYRAVVEYAYEVHGRKYRSTRLCFGAEEASGLRTRADAQSARFVPGAAVEVHVDPNDPTSAVLEPKVARSGLLLVIALGLLVIAVFVALQP